MIAIALESIKKDGVSEQEVAKGVAQQYPRPSFNISIRDLLKNINTKTKKQIVLSLNFDQDVVLLKSIWQRRGGLICISYQKFEYYA